MNIESIASVSVIVRTMGSATALFRDALGLPFEGSDGDYLYTEKLVGVKHFGIWPLNEAARDCFGVDDWPTGLPVPQASIEFELGSVEDVASAAEHLRKTGHELLHDVKEEPWGQTITRLLSQDGLIIGICYTPRFHE
jgi:hypothetical protein